MAGVKDLLYDWESDPGGASAIRAVNQGIADEETQKRAIRAIIHGICRYDEMQFNPENARLTDFALGMRFVAHQIAKVCTLDLARIERAKDYAAIRADSSRSRPNRVNR